MFFEGATFTSTARSCGGSGAGPKGDTRASPWLQEKPSAGYFDTPSQLQTKPLRSVGITFANISQGPRRALGRILRRIRAGNPHMILELTCCSAIPASHQPTFGRAAGIRIPHGVPWAVKLPDERILADISLRMRGVKEMGRCPLENTTQVPLPACHSLLLLYLHHPPISCSILFLLHRCCPSSCVQILLPPQSLHRFFLLPCVQKLLPPQSLNWLRFLPCEQRSCERTRP